MQRQPLTGTLRKAARVTLDSSGNGTITFAPDNARQSWQVDTVVVATDQAATATPVPVATVYIGGTTSPGNSQGASASGNQDTFSGTVSLGPADELSVAFTAGIPGSTAFANVSGTFSTRR